MSEQLVPSGVVISLPDAPLDDHVGVIEVLIQEGLTTLALPARSADFAEVVAIFGARATFGATRVADPETVRLAVERGATFVLADVASAAVAFAAHEAGVPCYSAAMTPNEVRAALALPGDGGVLLYPADVTGHAMASRLSELGLVSRVVALGNLGAYAAGEWLKAGAQAVCVDSTLLGNAYAGGSLGQLRDRCSSFVAVNKRD
ncbi:MAG: hypothetical protein QM713_07760 [Arachnia sp.]